MPLLPSLTSAYLCACLAGAQPALCVNAHSLARPPAFSLSVRGAATLPRQPHLPCSPCHLIRTSRPHCAWSPACCEPSAWCFVPISRTWTSQCPSQRVFFLAFFAVWFRTFVLSALCPLCVCLSSVGQEVWEGLARGWGGPARWSVFTERPLSLGVPMTAAGFVWFCGFPVSRCLCCV